MKVLQSPQDLRIAYEFDGPIVFLAGGISGCENWQDYIINKLQIQDKEQNYLLINPRRQGDLAPNGEMAEAQIIWEAEAMTLVDTMAFWFPKETLCPITLFEYGLSIGRKQDIILGVHLEYQRRFDLEIQTQHYRPRIKPVYSLDDFAQRISRCMGTLKS